MRLSFSHTLLITWFFLLWSCKTLYIHSHTENRNLVVSDSIIPVDSQLVNLYFPYKQKLDKDMSQVISVSAEEMIKTKQGDPVIVNQAWWGGLMVGQIDFVFERSEKTKETFFANNIM